jgi:GNAT superfamily N-acetyltransferase
LRPRDALRTEAAIHECRQVRAFAIDDPHQKLGIATHLISHLIEIARANGLEDFIAEVLPDNAPMLKVP